MKQNLFLLLALLFAGTSFGQAAFLQYRSVPAEHEEKFIERETKHWSKVAKAAIDKGEMVEWSLWRKVGVTNEDAPNYVFVNSFENLEQLDSNVWGSNMDALGDVNPGDIETMSFTKVTFSYYIQIEAVVEGDYKYAIVNYAMPKNLNGFIQENKTLWKPFHEDNIKGGGGMSAWGMASVTYPKGNMARFSVFTWDGFNNLSDALNYLSYQAPPEDDSASNPFAAIIAKSNMDEILPDGFQYSVIYERIMTVN
jgi:hypothetical protein